MDKPTRNMVVSCVNCGEEHVVALLGNAEFDASEPCDNCGTAGAWRILEDDRPQSKYAQCVYCDHVMPVVPNSFEASTPCPNCGKSGAYIMLDGLEPTCL